MTEKNNTDSKQKLLRFADTYLTDMTMQWIAALPLLIIGAMPLSVFVGRLFSEYYFMPYNVLDPLRTIFLVFSALAAVICVYLAVKGKRSLKGIIRGNIPFIIFAALLLWMLISYLVVGVPDFNDPFNNLGIFLNEGHLMYISFFTVFLFCGACITSYGVKTVIVRYYMITSFVFSALSLIDFYAIPMKPFRYFWSNCLPGVFNHPNHFGYYICVMTLLSVGVWVYEKDMKWRLTALASTLTHCALLVVNDTFGAYLAVWAAFVFFIATSLIVYKKFPVRLLVPIAALLLFTLVLTTWHGKMFDNFTKLAGDVSDIAANNENAKNAGSYRWLLWIIGVEGIADSPWFGQGVEGWADIIAKRSYDGVIHVHNEYLQYGLFFGIPAMILYFGGLLSVFIRGLINRKKLDAYTLIALSAAFGYCVSAFFGNPKYYTAPFFFAVLGLGYNYCRDMDKADTGASTRREKKNGAEVHSSVANS